MKKLSSTKTDLKNAFFMQKRMYDLLADTRCKKVNIN